ncbi:MAG: HAMP domain-containing histidine kinase [Proteobacteria bacterium]|nr:HAMP domain-containing histidine kinase [Pseudomonadota bacterium]MCL2308026.1 HAMP domain-containing histidine kinase [Pseudomonadota bacterium]
MYYPRSLVKFISLGFFLVSVPLVFALIELNTVLNELTRQSRENVFNSVTVSRLSRQFLEQATTLERLARQYTVLEDRAILNDYVRVREVLTDTQAQLTPLVSTDENEHFQIAMEEEARLFQILQRFQNNRENVAQIISGYRDFVAYAQAVQQVAYTMAITSVDQLQETADAGRKKWQILLWPSLGMAVFLAISLTFLIARPVQQIDQAIRQLGAAEFSKEIEVQGPSDLRYLGQRLEWLRARLQTLEEQQTKFLRNLSHELKTPLTAIREGNELLRDGIGGNLNDEQREILYIVRENTLSLQRMIEDLLQYHQSRVTEPSVLLPVDLADIVHHVVRDHRLAAWTRLISFEEKLLPLLVTGNVKKITTVVDNLISNAIKYSPRLGKIQLLMSVDKDCARLEVIDEGPGIPESERERVFESFYQGSQPTDNRVKGSGLGLTIAREYVLAHGGRISAKKRSDGRSGARLVLRLPFWTSTLPLIENSRQRTTTQGAS